MILPEQSQWRLQNHSTERAKKVSNLNIELERQELDEIDARNAKNVSTQTNSFLEVKLQLSLTKPDEDKYVIRDTVRSKILYTYKQRIFLQVPEHRLRKLT